ncbi:hypothetical protein ACOMHN_020864 [Nucella lapillus]
MTLKSSLCCASVKLPLIGRVLCWVFTLSSIYQGSRIMLALSLSASIVSQPSSIMGALERVEAKDGERAYTYIPLFAFVI